MFCNIDTIVFSKDRAAQLDLFLHSFFINFPIGTVFVIYTASNEDFYKGYHQLQLDIENLTDVSWIKQNGTIKEELYNILSKCEHIINLCTDDCVYFRNPCLKIEDINNILDEKTLCFSPRLGLNTIVQDYRTRELQPPLEPTLLSDKNDIIRWNWVKRQPLQNYGFACHQDSYICRKDDFLKIADFDWQNMRQLEGTLALERRHTMYYKPMMASLGHSFCVNIPVNNISPGLYYGNNCYQSLEDMNKKFLNGYRLSLTKSNFNNIIGAHQEIKLIWENHDGIE